LVRTLLQVARDRERYPIHYREALVLARQIERLHPDWLNLAPDKAGIEESLMWYRHAWNELSRDAYWRPKGFFETRTFVHDTVRRTMASHRRRKEARRRGELPSTGIDDPDVLALRSTLPP